MKRIHLLLLVFGVLIGISVAKFAAPKKPLAEPLPTGAQGLRTELDAYGPKHFSERNEEVIIRHFFRDRRDGFFLDVGSYHYRDGSNTYYLEKYLGWSGVAIDANSEFARGYEENRPKTKFFSFFVSDKSDEKADFFIVRDPGHLTKSTAVQSFVSGRKTEEVKVPTITLDSLLSKLGIKHIDLLSLDIELWEPQALAGFDIELYKPSLVCVEAHHQVRDQVLDYFAKHHYIRLDEYFLFDQRNWYFTPSDLYKKIFEVNY